MEPMGRDFRAFALGVGFGASDSELQGLGMWGSKPIIALVVILVDPFKRNPKGPYSNC